MCVDVSYVVRTYITLYAVLDVIFNIQNVYIPFIRTAL